MAANNVLDSLYKDVFGDGTIRALPDFAKIQRRVDFSQKEKTGDFYEVPVLLGFEHGFTYAVDGDGVVSLNTSVAGNVKKARVQGCMIYLRSRMSYEDLMKASSAGPAAFESASGLVVDNMERSFARRLELAFLYGQQGIGKVLSVAGNVITLTAASFGAGIWTGMKDCPLEFWSSQAATATERDTGETWSVSEVNQAAGTRTVTVTGSSSGTLAQVVANDHIYFYGARTSTAHKECAGLDKILTNTSTLFNIDAASFEMWKSTERAVNAEISMLGILNGIADATNKGLEENAVCWLNPVNWNKLNSDQAALRRHGAEMTGEAKNGTRAISYYSTNGATEIEAHPLMKNADGFLVANPAKRVTRVGASDITFKLPGYGETVFHHVTDSTAIELRAMADQAICVQVPGHCVKYSGIVAPS